MAKLFIRNSERLRGRPRRLHDVNDNWIWGYCEQPGNAVTAKAQEKKAEKVEPEDRKLDAAPAASAMPSNPNSTSVEDKKEKKMQKMQKTQKLEKKMEEEAPPAEGEMPEKKECHYEDESAPEEKKMDAGDTDVHEGTPEGPQVSLEEGEEDKKILEYIKYKFGKSLDEVQGKLFALEGEADKTVKLQKQLKDQKKLSKERRKVLSVPSEG